MKFLLPLILAACGLAQTTTPPPAKNLKCSTLIAFGAMETVCDLSELLGAATGGGGTTSPSTPDTVRCEAVDPYGTYMEIVIYPADVAITLSDKALLTPDLLKQPHTVQIAKSAVPSRAAWLALPVEQRVGFIRFGVNMPVAQVKAGCIEAIWGKAGPPL